MMTAFCPSCANLLVVRRDDGIVRYVCWSCPYTYRLKKETVRPIKTLRKRADDVFGDDDAFKGGQKTETSVCPKCSHHEASFIELQTRSADEPMTVFYKCVKCKTVWKE